MRQEAADTLGIVSAGCVLCSTWLIPASISPVTI